MREIKIGTRSSPLSIAQTNIIAAEILRTWPEIKITLVKIKTSGDKHMLPFTDNPNGIKGMFTLELEQALMNHEIDFAVHSLKDLPVCMNSSLPIVAYSHRDDPRDALIVKHESKFAVQSSDSYSLMAAYPHSDNSRDILINREDDFAAQNSDSRINLYPSIEIYPHSDNSRDALINRGGVIGTSSLRRKLQLERLYPDSKIIPVRGNVNSRIQKMSDNQYDALVLAAAGLKRLGLEDRITKIFSIDEIMPAPAQGILACQGRSDEDYGYLECVNDTISRDCALAERSFSRALNAGCNVPIGAYAAVHDDMLTLRGLYIDEKTKEFHRGSITGRRYEAEALGERLAEVIMS